MDDYSPQMKLWLEASGQLVMSDYRLSLLQHVADAGSLAQAATRMGLSYRRAWGKVKELEQNLGLPLVESVVGGAGGGGTRLTAEGEALVAAYRRFQSRTREAAGRAFAEELLPILRTGAVHNR